MSSVSKDSVLAQNIVSRGISNITGEAFHSNSIIYRFTNENISSIPYADAIKEKRKILSVIGSGDHIINSILQGSTDISGYDISRFPKYFLGLKLAAIKALSYEDFLSFFTGDTTEEFNEELYDKLACCLDSESREFWDSLFDYFEGEEIYSSTLFSSEPFSRNGAVSRNLYLEKENYYKVKSLIGDIKIKFYHGNIFDMASSLKDGYDLINLSNIWYYMPTKDRLDNYRKFLEKLPLSNDGVALSYLYTSSNSDAIEKSLSQGVLSSSVVSLPPTSCAIVLSKNR